MKKIIISLIIISGVLLGGVKTEVETSGPSATEVITYKGPKARIAVGRFEVKAPKASWEIGEGIKDMLIDALFKTGRFIVLEKGEGLSDLKEEFQLKEGGWSKEGLKKGTFETADIILTGAITAFEPEYKGKGGGGIVIPLPFKVGGGLKIEKKEAYIAAHLRLVDVSTRRIIKTAKVEGYASKHKVGILGGGMAGSVILGTGFEKYKNTPMEKAVMVMLENAVKEIVKDVPENYYKYSATGQPVKPASSTPSTPAGSSTIVGGQAASGDIIGGEEQFVPGDKVLFAEDFSKYNLGDIPRSLRIVRGQVEVAQFSGRKWLRALSGDVVVTKKINLPKNFAVEFDVYPSFKEWPGPSFDFYLGNEHSSDHLWWSPSFNSSYPKWSGQSLQKIKLDEKGGVIHHFAVQQKNGMIKVFVDGVRDYQAPIGGGIVGGKMPNRNAITLKLSGANPSEHKEALVTNIKVTEYTK